MKHVHLAGGLAVRSDGRVLMVASHYPNHVEPLWNLPGGRQHSGELLSETVVREIFEETGLAATIGRLAYVSESYDGDTHFVSATFLATVSEPYYRIDTPKNNDHVVDVAWVEVDRIASLVAVSVVREPLLAYLRGDLGTGYAGFHEAGITIEWPENSS